MNIKVVAFIILGLIGLGGCSSSGTSASTEPSTEEEVLPNLISDNNSGSVQGVVLGCTAMEVVLLDDQGAGAEAPSAGIDFDISWSLNSGATAAVSFYESSANCVAGTNAKTTFTFADGESSLTFYAKPDAVGDVTISYTNNDPPAGSMEGTNISGGILTSPSKPKLVSPAGPFTASACSGPFHVDSVDGAGTQVNVTSNQFIDIIGGSYSNASGMLRLFSDSGCTTLYSAGDVSISNGTHSSNDFYMQVWDSGATAPAAIAGSVELWVYPNGASSPSVTELGYNIATETVSFQ